MYPTKCDAGDACTKSPLQGRKEVSQMHAGMKQAAGVHGHATGSTGQSPPRIRSTADVNATNTSVSGTRAQPLRRTVNSQCCAGGSQSFDASTTRGPSVLHLRRTVRAGTGRRVRECLSDAMNLTACACMSYLKRQIGVAWENVFQSMHNRLRYRGVWPAEVQGWTLC